MVDVEFDSNEALYSGGGMHLSTYNDLTMDHVTFESNVAGTHGGGLYSYGLQSGSTLTDVVFEWNVAGDNGGGARFYNSTVDIANCVFTYNEAD